MEAKRTPGEWFVHHDSMGYAVETEHVRIVNLGHSNECAKGDAYLMAAAPDLLAAAIAVIDRWDTPLWKDVPATANYINVLRAAVAKGLGDKSPGQKV